MELKKIKYNLKEDGFCFLPKTFLNRDIKNARDGLRRVINCEYRSGREPENRFWNPGDDPSSIIKIDKPHLSDQSIWDLITNKKLGQLLGKITNSKFIQVWHSQVVWKPHSKNQNGNAGCHTRADCCRPSLATALLDGQSQCNAGHGCDRNRSSDLDLSASDRIEPMPFPD